MKQTYRQIIEVTPQDLDELNHVNNIRYIEWIQNISKAHWQKLTGGTYRNTFVWVVRKHEVKYLGSAKLNDSLSVTTYIGETRGAISVRVVEIKDNKTGDLLVKSSTEWCLLDSTSLKPKRVPEHIVNLFL